MLSGELDQRGDVGPSLQGDPRCAWVGAESADGAGGEILRDPGTSGHQRAAANKPRSVAGLAVLMALGVVGGAASAAGQSPEVTVLAGLRLGGVFEDAAKGGTRHTDEGLAASLILGFPFDADRTFEVVWTHGWVTVPAALEDGASLELKLDTVGVGGTYDWPRGKWRPFVSGTGGLTVMSPQQSGLDREALLTMTLGGGVKLPVFAKVDIRLEGRGLFMLASGSASGVCGGQGCVLVFSGAGLVQFEFLAGVSWVF